jgi:hypothetical protein
MGSIHQIVRKAMLERFRDLRRNTIAASGDCFVRFTVGSPRATRAAAVTTDSYLASELPNSDLNAQPTYDLLL